MSYTHALITIVVITICCIGGGFPLYNHYHAKYKLNPAVVFGVFFGLVAAMLLLQAIVYWPGPDQQIYAELACMAGASLGWLIGMWLSPMGSTESTKFSGYWTVIGVGSGFTLKWGLDRIVGQVAWFKGHAFITTLFVVSLFVTVAAVYNSRAYNDCIVIAPRKPLASTTSINGDWVEVKAGTEASFYAAVTGPNDPLARWEVLASTLDKPAGTGVIGTIDQAGLFKAGAAPGEGRISAFNIENPTLSNSIVVKIVA